MNCFIPRIIFAVTLMAGCGRLEAETISIVIASNPAPRVEFGVEKLAEALKSARLNAVIARCDARTLSGLLTGAVPEKAGGRKIYVARMPGGWARESFILSEMKLGNNPVVMGCDDSGVLYGCLELASRIRAAGRLPEELNFHDAPAMKLRGACVGMQKTFILPGRKVYEYPYTPELFPWFYDKELWGEYLDFLAANRMNTLYLWSGHPFASLVRLKDYPYAVEVPDEVFQKNQAQFRWLATECDRRGIWLVQMFYNIFVSKPFAETHHISTQLSAPTPLTADYTRKSIAEFVRQFRNVGLMVCLGEALRDTPNQLEWCTNVILPGVLDGMRAAHLPEEPPVVIRTHAMDAEAILPAAFQVYTNLFTESKYNGESLTTWEPRGKDQATHLAMSKLGPHLVNIHILANLEPFRYGDTEFIKKCVQASRERLGATGMHLYPLSYWNWPHAPDVAGGGDASAPSAPPQLLQWRRDWIWFAAWARYAWNPDVPAKEDRAYWVSRFADFYGNTSAAEKILDAYHFSGEVAPRLIRRFGITEGNRQTLSLGMTLDQLVNPNKYGAIEDLWLSQAPSGERLEEFVRKEWNHEPHAGETPESIIAEVLSESSNAVALADSASALVNRNRDEFERLRNDARCIQAMAKNYADKVRAAAAVWYHHYSHDAADLDRAEKFLAASLTDFAALTELTTNTYRFANSMQTNHRKIPVVGAVKGKPANYLWSQLLPLYETELKNFQATVQKIKAGEPASLIETNSPKPKGNPELAEPAP